MVNTTYSSPKAYIESRREPGEYSYARRKELLARYFDPAELEKRNLESKGDISQCLLELLKPRLPKIVVDLLDSKRVAIGLVDDPTPNAHLITLDCGHAIVINNGLVEFIYRVTRALSTKFISPGDSEEKVFPIEETSRVIFEIFDWYVGSWQRIGKEHAAGPNYSVSRTQVILANNLALEAECFFLAHEMGHLLCELSSVSSLNISSLKDPDEDEETFADKFAFWALMSAWGKPASDNYHPDLAFAGAFVALRMFESLHRYSERAYQTKFAGPHPDAGRRRVNLLNWAWELCGGHTGVFGRVTRLASLIDFTLGAVDGVLDRPEFENYYMESAGAVISELESLLDEWVADEHSLNCTAFRKRAHALIDRGYPTLLMSRVAQEIVEPLKAGASMSDEEFAALPECEVTEGRRKVKKMMLLYSLVDDLREPYQSLWLQALSLKRNSRHART
jgi:hypothetical protein